MRPVALSSKPAGFEEDEVGDGRDRRQGPQNFWFAAPPPVDRQVNIGLAA
jgi:hypothetical protein